MSIRLTPCDRLTSAITSLAPNNKIEWTALGFSCASMLVSSGASIAAWTGYISYKWAAAKKISQKQQTNPDEVSSIYTPPHPSPEDLNLLSQYSHRIEQLRTDPSCLGIAFVLEKNTNRPVPVYIRYTENPEEFTVQFTVHRLSDD